MKKNEMAERVALKNLNVVLKNFQGYIMKSNPDDGRLETLREIQQKIQTCVDGKNVIPVEDLKRIEESLREDIKNKGDFKSAREIVDDEMVSREMNDYLDKIDKENRELPDQGSLDNSDARKKGVTVESSRAQKPLPTPPQKPKAVAARGEPVTSAESSAVSSKGAGTTQPPVKTPEQRNQMIKSLLTKSQQRYEAPAPKQDPQKENMLKAFEELSTKGISFLATEALDDAKKSLKEGKASTDTVKTFLAAVIHPEKVKGFPVTKISGDEKDLLQKFMNTAGVKKAVETDPAIRFALKNFADKLPKNSQDIVKGPVQEAQKAHAAQKSHAAERPVSVKK